MLQGKKKYNLIEEIKFNIYKKDKFLYEMVIQEILYKIFKVIVLMFMIFSTQIRERYFVPHIEDLGIISEYEILKQKN